MRGRTPRASIIYYHAIGDATPQQDPFNLFVSPALFATHMRFLAAKRSVVPLEAILSGAIPSHRPAVAITFDDGYENVLMEAGPILRRYDFPATVFVPTAWIGRTSDWIDESEIKVQVMDEDQLRQADRSGLAIECHGHVHLDYSQATREESELDLARSIEILADVLERPPRYFAYPYGRSSEVSRSVLADSGLDAAFATDKGPASSTFAFERVPIRASDQGTRFALKTSGHYLQARFSWAGRTAAAAVRAVKRS